MLYHNSFSISTKSFWQTYPGIRILGFWSIYTEFLFSCTRKGCREMGLRFFRFFGFYASFIFLLETKEYTWTKLTIFLIFSYSADLLRTLWIEVFNSINCNYSYSKLQITKVTPFMRIVYHCNIFNLWFNEIALILEFFNWFYFRIIFYT